MKESLVIITSSNREINYAKTTGILNYSAVSYLNILKKRIDYLQTKPMTSCNAKKIVKIRNMFSDMMNKCPNLCNYRMAVNLLCESPENENVHVNNPPTVSGVEKNYPEQTHTFSYSDFTREFNDMDQGDQPKYVEIISLPMEGVIKFYGAPIPANFVFDLIDVDNLTYEPEENIASNIVMFSFKTSDDNQKPLFSNEADYIFNISNMNNMPPTTGDNEITVQKNVVTALSLEMFTSQTTPPYNDPENDLIDAIRVDRLHTTNIGTFELNQTPVSEGQIITREQLANEEFKHVGRDEKDIHTDGFEFSVRDEGSGIWVK